MHSDVMRLTLAMRSLMVLLLVVLMAAAAATHVYHAMEAAKEAAREDERKAVPNSMQLNLKATLYCAAVYCLVQAYT